MSISLHTTILENWNWMSDMNLSLILQMGESSQSYLINLPFTVWTWNVYKRVLPKAWLPSICSPIEKWWDFNRWGLVEGTCPWRRYFVSSPSCSPLISQLTSDWGIQSLLPHTAITMIFCPTAGLTALEPTDSSLEPLKTLTKVINK